MHEMSSSYVGGGRISILTLYFGDCECQRLLDPRLRVFEHNIEQIWNILSSLPTLVLGRLRNLENPQVRCTIPSHVLTMTPKICLTTDKTAVALCRIQVSWVCIFSISPWHSPSPSWTPCQRRWQWWLKWTILIPQDYKAPYWLCSLCRWWWWCSVLVL